jgi:hypothetical protein
VEPRNIPFLAPNVLRKLGTTGQSTSNNFARTHRAWSKAPLKTKLVFLFYFLRSSIADYHEEFSVKKVSGLCAKLLITTFYDK